MSPLLDVRERLEELERGPSGSRVYVLNSLANYGTYNSQDCAYCKDDDYTTPKVNQRTIWGVSKEGCRGVRLYGLQSTVRAVFSLASRHSLARSPVLLSVG